MIEQAFLALIITNLIYRIGEANVMKKTQPQNGAGNGNVHATKMAQVDYMARGA